MQLFKKSCEITSFKDNLYVSKISEDIIFIGKNSFTRKDSLLVFVEEGSSLSYAYIHTARQVVTPWKLFCQTLWNRRLSIYFDRQGIASSFLKNMRQTSTQSKWHCKQILWVKAKSTEGRFLNLIYFLVFSFSQFLFPFFLVLPHHAGLEVDVFLLFSTKILVAAFWGVFY